MTQAWRETSVMSLFLPHTVCTPTGCYSVGFGGTRGSCRVTLNAASRDMHHEPEVTFGTV